MRTLTSPPRRRTSRGSCEDPPRLWGDEPAPTAPAAAVTPVDTPDATTALAEPSRTLDDLIAGAWEGLSAGTTPACPVCATAMTPRWSAGAGVVGGRCGGCGSTLE